MTTNVNTDTSKDENTPLLTTTSVVVVATPTPLPKLKLGLMCLVQFCEAFSANALFAYLGFMILDFGIAKNASDVGFYSGFVGSSFFFCQFLSSFFWGRLSDTFGRRKVILIGLSGSIVSSILFGFSKNLALAIVSRCINGGMNGNLPVAKTYLGEVTDKSNQALAFTYFAMSWGFGIIVGPLAGGLLSLPTEQYKWWPKWLMYGLLQHYPFLLPNLVTALIYLTTLVLCYFYLEETITKMHKNDVKIRKSFKSSFLEIFGDKIAMVCCCVYALLCFGAIIFVEVFPIWSITARADGGFEFDTTNIGFMLGIAGFYGVLVQIITFKPLAKRFSYKKIFIGSVLAMAVVVALLMEVGRLLPQPKSDFEQKAGFWIACAACLCLNQQFMLSSFSAMNIMMNNSVPFNKMGAMNGVAMSLAALCRAIGPTLGANIFALTTEINHFYIISFRTAFYMVSIIYLCNAIFSLKLPARVNAPYIDPLTALKDPVTIK